LAIDPHDCGQQAIAAAPDACDITRRLRIVVQAVAQQFDSLADGLRAYDQPGPHAVHQFIGGNHAGRGLDQRHQQVEGQFWQRQIDAGAGYRHPARVHDQVVDPVYKGNCLPGTGFRWGRRVHGALLDTILGRGAV
jgi:hypothetical protein